jgi:hypothetical protein
MRRTSRRGWTAKGIDNSGGSIIDLEELSDTESLDSFFDDDFDDTSKEESLNQFLCCNTLGVESKGHKADWRAGELSIPEFHCPRCRDHWYGLTSYPCDEELARLIREGKWYTGRGDSLKKRSDRNDRDRMKTDNEDDTRSYSSDSLALPDINSRKGANFQTKKSGHHIEFVDFNLQKNAKKNRRISFKVGSEYIDDDTMGNGSSNTSLDEKKNNSRRSLSNARNGMSDGDDKGSVLNGQESSRDGNRTKRNIDSSSSTSDVNSSSSSTLLQDQEKYKDKKEDMINGLGKAKDKKKGSKNDETNDKSYGFGNGRSSKNDSVKNSDKLHSQNGNLGNGFIGLENGGIKSSTNDADKTSNGQVYQGTDNNDNYHKSSSNGPGIDDQQSEASHTAAAGGTNNSSKTTGLAKSSKDYTNSSQRSSRSNSLYGGSQRWGPNDGDDKNQLVHGKGYMRASNPSQSEWGDPTHARMWASNTATSSRVSSANSRSRRNNDDDHSDDVRPITLPPIIRKKADNPFSLGLPEGFELTRAFTFSYY